MLWSPPHGRTSSERFGRLVNWPIVVLCCCAWGCSSLRTLHEAVGPGNSDLASSDPAARLAASGTRALDAPEFDELPTPSRPAVSRPLPPAIAAPKPFAWDRIGKSTGGRPFQTLTTGKDGFRTLVVGSVGGHDPAAQELVDQLARHLHENSLILGGFEAVVIRTLNPDGAANRQHVNQQGNYVNALFPEGARPVPEGARPVPEGARPVKPADVECAEVRFLLEQISSFQPQRVVHIRTVQRQRGVVAASISAESAARDVATWLKLDFLRLGADSAHGSLEKFVSVRADSQMITLGIPAAAEPAGVWDLYGDALLNLLLNEDLATRDVARRQQEQNAARRQGQTSTLPGGNR